MSKAHIYLGKSGEDVAVDLLRDSGYKILLRNYKTKLGEIDIVAKDKDTFCFIEVKTRRSDKLGLAKEAVSVPKQRQVSKAALMFLKENNLLAHKARFDVVSVMYSEYKPKVELIKDAFELEGRYAI